MAAVSFYVDGDGPDDFNALDDLLRDHVARCRKCKRVKFIADEELGQECGPDFGKGTLCDGKLELCNDHDTLLAAYKLGGEEAAYLVLFDGCRMCIAEHLYGKKNIRCSDHKR